MQWWRDWKPHKWISIHFALEQFSGPEGSKDGILFVYYNFYEEKKVCDCVRTGVRACMRVFSYHSSSVSPSTVASPSSNFQYLHAFINEVTILVPVLSSDSKHTFAIYTPERTKQRWPIRLAAATELEMHDWVCEQAPPYLSWQTEKTSSFLSLPLILKLALLSVSCCDSRGIQGPPSKQAIWSITCKGDIFISEPSLALEAIPYPTPSDQM